MFAAPIFLLIAMSQVWITTETGDIIVMVALLSGSLIEVSIQVSGQKHNATKNSPTYVVQVLCKYFFFSAWLSNFLTNFLLLRSLAIVLRSSSYSHMLVDTSYVVEFFS